LKVYLKKLDRQTRKTKRGRKNKELTPAHGKLREAVQGTRRTSGAGWTTNDFVRKQGAKEYLLFAGTIRE